MHVRPHACTAADLPIPELVENRRRPLARHRKGQPLQQVINRRERARVAATEQK
jgi:hypothetical protein